MWCDRVEMEQRIRVRVRDSLALKLCRESAERAETSAYCPTICIRKYRAVRITAGRPAEFSYERRSRGQRRNKFRPFPVARLRSCIRDEKKKKMNVLFSQDSEADCSTWRFETALRRGQIAKLPSYNVARR